MRLTLLLLPLALLVAADRASAQATPGNVNDCTLLPDPVELRNCVLRFESNRTAPPTTLETPSGDLPPVAAGSGTTQVDQATPAPAPRRVPPTTTNPRAAVAPLGSPAIPASPAPARPRPARDTETSIEQVELPRTRQH